MLLDFRVEHPIFYLKYRQRSNCSGPSPSSQATPFYLRICMCTSTSTLVVQNTCQTFCVTDLLTRLTRVANFEFTRFYDRSLGLQWSFSNSVSPSATQLRCTFHFYCDTRISQSFSARRVCHSVCSHVLIKLPRSNHSRFYVRSESFQSHFSTTVLPSTKKQLCDSSVTHVQLILLRFQILLQRYVRMSYKSCRDQTVIRSRGSRSYFSMPLLP